MATHCSQISRNCTFASNQIGNANSPTTTTGGGLYLAGGFVTNTILYYNWNRRLNAASDVYAAHLGRLAYSCAAELTNSANFNTTNAPQFVNLTAGDFRLLPGSPGVNEGINLPWMADELDLDGKPRIRRGQVDMGAYETAPPSGTVIIVR